MRSRHIIATALALIISAVCLSLSAVGAFREKVPKQTEKEGSESVSSENSILLERERIKKKYLTRDNEICRGEVQIYDYTPGDVITVWDSSYLSPYIYQMDIAFDSFKCTAVLPEYLMDEDVHPLEAGELYLITEVSITSHSEKDEIYQMNSIEIEGNKRTKELQTSSGREFIESARAHYELHPEETLTCELVFIIDADRANDFSIVVDNCGVATYCGHTAILNIKNGIKLPDNTNLTTP